MNSSPDTFASTVEMPIVADFSVTIDPPLVKKFDFMNSGIVPMWRYRRDLDLIDDLKTQSLRVDFFWGEPQINGWTTEMISGSADDLRFDFSEIDELSRLLKERGIGGYWSYCYNPLPLQAGFGHASHPSNLEAWREIMYQFARHFRENDLRPDYHAIWNEPDLDIFYNRPVEVYSQLYKFGVEGLRAGDPDAFVGGPDLAFTDEWIEPFLDFIEENNLPLDFFAFHAIGLSPISRVNSARRKIKIRPYFDTTELVFSELNPSMIFNSPQAPVVRYTQAALILDHIARLVDEPDITRVHWAQFMDSSVDTLGVVSLDGHRRAAYNAFKLYAMMPVDRRAVEVSGSLSALASTDAQTSSLLLWNRSRSDKRLSVVLKNIPFARGTLRVYRIDEEHASYFENPDSEELTAVETHEDVVTSDLTWQGEIPDHGVLYLQVSDGSGASELTEIEPVAEIIRINRYFPDRSKDNFAEFDRSSWIARLGMGSQDFAESRLGIVMEDVPSALEVSVETEGEMRNLDANSLLGLRLDYADGNGYAKAVLVHSGLYSPARDAKEPWGTERQADEIVELDDLSMMRLEPARFAPAGWNGRLIITFMMQNTGAATRAKVVIRRAP
ncbi:MAG: hypothetical protein OXG53_02735 [Chloroflexi bacterium]|nr:hypothetical protein [Chloroflexota bacterium]